MSSFDLSEVTLCTTIIGQKSEEILKKVLVTVYCF
jgi:hypothetical protein